MAKSSPSKPEPLDFGEFTRDRVVDILKKSGDTESPAFAIMAATLLASIDAQGPSPRDMIATALDVLARTDTAVAHDLLWQAAEHARNPHIRVEAIRRSGPIATSERSALLRKWATEGFQPTVNLQHDQIDLNCIKTAAIHAIGKVKEPTKDDLEMIMAAMTPPSNMAEFSTGLFSTACEAYWSGGNVASLPKLVELISQRWRADIGFPLMALAAKFSVKELKPYVESLRKALCECTGDWPGDTLLANRLPTLVERLASPEFFQEWVSHHGREGLEHGRGQVTSKLLEGFKRPSDGAVNGLLMLARWPHNLAPNGPVVKWLAKCVGAGYGKLITQKIVTDQNEGYSQLLKSGDVYALYDSVDAALTNICEALSAMQNAHHRQNVAGMVATGALAGVCLDNETDNSPPKTTGRRNQGQDAEEDRELLARKVSILEQCDLVMNPIAVAARLLSPPTSSSGAMAVCEGWLKHGDSLARHVMQMIVREAGRAEAFGQDAPMLARFEQCVLASQPQQPSLRPSLEAVLVSEVAVDGRLNRYAIDLMQRTDLSFEKGAENALHRVQAREDAQFVLQRLYDKGAIDALTKSTCFHQDGNEPLTTCVRATAIALATRLLIQTDHATRRLAFAEQLHRRFQDLPSVRETAYHACGEISSFPSIKPLQTRLLQETAPSAKKAIEQAIDVLRKRLVAAKPQQGSPDAIKQWLGFIADLGDPAMLQYVVGYLRPLHDDHTVQHAAINAVQHMVSRESLELVKNFITDIAPEGQTLAMARHARLVLEERRDSDLFEVLGKLYSAQEEVVDPAIDYAKLLGNLLPTMTKGLNKSLELFNDGHWDEYVTRISGLMESVARLVFRRRYDLLGVDKDKVNKIQYRNLLNVTEFHTTYPKLQSHCDTIYTYRGESPTAHATSTDGSEKSEATSDDAECVRDEFKRAFVEAIKALR